MTTLLGRILTSRKLPSKGQLLQATANRAKSFIKNPINTLKDGLNAHKTANNIATNQSTITGRTLRRNLNPARAVKTGLNREKTMYNSVNNSLSKLPRVPAGVSFSSSYLLCDFNVSTTKYRR